MTAAESNTKCQCKAITSSGKRCTRQRRVGFNGYCAQHAKANESAEVEQRPDPSRVSDAENTPNTTASGTANPALETSSPSRWDYASVKARAAGNGPNPQNIQKPAGGQHRTPSSADNGDKPVTGLMSKLSSPAVDNAPHLIVEARAGTGKTTTLIEGLKRLRGVPTPGFVPSPEQEAVFRSMELSRGFDRTIGFVAFNKSIATELQSRVPRGCEAKTMHGMGYSAVRRAFGNVDVTGDKVPPRVLTILEEIEGKNIRELRKENNVLVKAVERLVSLCKMNLTDATEPRNLDDLAAHYDVELNGSREKVYSLVPRILDRCKDVARDNAVDFDDMIWIPVVLDLPVFRFDILLVDEAQDLNRCQQALAKKAGKRLILCGDPFQAIYGFAGADSDSMPRMERELSSIPCSGSRTPNCECQGCRENRRQGLRGCVVLPLTVTRRCGRAIVKEAQRLVPTFSAHESNPEGKVTMMRYPLQPGAKWGTAIQIKIEDTYVPHVKDGDMVICRTNAPLVRECLRFIRLGKRATIQGRDVGQGIINVVLKMDASSIPDLMTKLDGWYSKEVAKERAKDHPREHYIESLADKRECIVSLMDGASTVDEVVKKIESIFSDKTDLPGILLSSIHRAKGLESKTVFFLSPDVQPRRPAEKMQPHELEQEKNLEYVGITRAIEHLVRVY